MSYTKETASLVLRSFDIVNTFSPLLNVGDVVDNTYGTITANAQVITWKNVDMKLVLGDLYETYDRYNLVLTSVCVNNNGINIISGNSSITLRGLTFCNQTYNTRNGVTNEAYIGVQNYIMNQTNGQSTPITSGVVTFRKNTDLVDLTIELKAYASVAPLYTQNGYTEKFNNIFGHQTYIFDIYGCDGYETDKHHLVRKNRL